MTKKEMTDLLLSKVDPDKKAAFVSELKSINGPDELTALLGKYGITMTDDELKALSKNPDDVQELSAAELDLVSGGCCWEGCDTYVCDDDCGCDSHHGSCAD